MICIAEHLQVDYSVISRITIDMMHVFVSGKFASQVMLHDKAMQSCLASIYCDRPVFVWWFSGWLKPMFGKLRKMHFRKTGTRAVLGIFRSIFWNIVRLSTVQTLFYYSIAGFWFPPQM